MNQLGIVTGGHRNLNWNFWMLWFCCTNWTGDSSGNPSVGAVFPTNARARRPDCQVAERQGRVAAMNGFTAHGIAVTVAVR